LKKWRKYANALAMQIKHSIYFSAVIGALMVGSFSLMAQAGPNCTCRFAGKNFKTGAIMCIRGKLSKCGFVLNNTSWKTIAETCPQVMLLPDTNKKQTDRAARLPQSTLMVRLKTRLQF